MIIDLTIEDVDAGTDEGADAGTDEGADAGTDEGVDAGTNKEQLVLKVSGEECKSC